MRLSPLRIDMDADFDFQMRVSGQSFRWKADDPSTTRPSTSTHA
jgi:hypothetical protein